MGKKNNIQKKLRDTQAPLSDQYSWENMESGILSKLDDIVPVVVDDKSSSKRVIYLMLLGLLPLVGVGGYYFGLSQNDNNNTSKSISNQEQSIQNTQDFNIQSNTNTLDIPKNNPEVYSEVNSITTIESTENTKQSDQTSATSAISKVNTNEQSVNLSGQLSTEGGFYGIPLSSNENDGFNSLSNDDEDSYLSYTSIIDDASVIETNTSKILNEAIALSSLFRNAYPTLGSAIAFDESRMVNRLIAINQDAQLPNQKLPLRLILSFGSNIYDHNYSGNDLAIARNNADSYILGQSAALTLDIPINDKWTINTGVGIDRSVTRLDYSGVQDTMLNAEVLTHNHNNVSGITTTTSENQIVTGTFLTDVELFNNTMSLSIPLSLQREVVFSQYTLGIGAGVEYNYRYAKSGRYLSQPAEVSTDYQLRSYSDQDPYKSHLFNGLVSAHIDYSIANGFGIGLGLNGTYNINNAIDEIGINSNPIRIRGNLRLFRKF